jgi:hypothetical protein
MTACASCVHCHTKFERGHYQNRHKRPSARVTETGLYCGRRCRTAAWRKRAAELPPAGPTAPQNVSWLPTPLGASHAPRGPSVTSVSATRKLPPGIVADATSPGMYRLVLLDGRLSDMVNLARARDALRRASA